MPDGRPDCTAEPRRGVGLSCDQLVTLAEEAHFRRASRVVKLGGDHGPPWETWR